MTVHDLIIRLRQLDPQATVVTNAPDHEYRTVMVRAATGLRASNGVWTEDYGEADTPEAEYGKRLPIVIIG